MCSVVFYLDSAPNPLQMLTCFYPVIFDHHPYWGSTPVEALFPHLPLADCLLSQVLYYLSIVNIDRPSTCWLGVR